MPAIEARQIQKSFLRGKQRADVLRGVDLKVKRGEIVFLVGPSGSGKSTLLAILGCILSPDQGDVRLLGQSLRGLSPEARTLLRRDKIGFVFQKFQLIRGLTAIDNVREPLMLKGVSDSVSQQRGRELLVDVGLADHLTADPRRMSAGQCQRIAIARALASDPELIFADEPTASLDETNGRLAMELFARLVRERNKTAIVVTHDPRIYSFADRILEVKDGMVREHSTGPIPQTALVGSVPLAKLMATGS
jgi:putative ABC transport system ATP-binding protein